MDTYVREAAHVARRSNQLHSWHGCVIVNKENGAIVATGYNHTLPKRLKETYSVHAEMHALSKFGTSLRSKYPNCFMVVVRVGRNGDRDVKFSMPCPTCQRMIAQQRSIRKVYYTVFPS